MRQPFLIILTFLSLGVFAQRDLDVKLQLANEFYQNKEFEKSIDLYEEVFRRNQSKEVYQPLFNSYLAIEDYQSAEKLAEKQLKRNERDPVYQVDLGYVLILKGEEKKGENVYEDAIKELPPNTSTILALSNSFQRRNEINYAIETLLRGKKLTGNFYGYEFELGELYYQTGNLESMVNEYLDLLEKNEGYIQNVQNALNTSIYHDPKPEQIEILNKALLKRIQKNPGKIIFSELLIWHYLQQKDFRGAITQTKALDKRNDENGFRFLSLAKSCRSNREFDLALECYQYIIEKGPTNQHYIGARIMTTETIRDKITSAPYTQEDLLRLEENYVKTLEDIGTTGATVSLQIGLAEVRAFYLDKEEDAVNMLEYALNRLSLSDENAAKCKMLLGDIYLLQGEIWEASLLYSQVEKDFKYDELGDKAKFKNAKIYFYTGDFGWAKAQLDVLKGSTSKLISNDAMRLSLLISDNLAFDTTGAALRMFGRASLQFEQDQLDDALSTLDTMQRIYIAHNIIDEVHYLKAQVFIKRQDYENAAKDLQTIAEQYGYDILADKALFRLAELEESYLNHPEKAQEYYKKLFTDYPASVYVTESRKRFRKMRGDEIN